MSDKKQEILFWWNVFLASLAGCAIFPAWIAAQARRGDMGLRFGITCVLLFVCVCVVYGVIKRMIDEAGK